MARKNLAAVGALLPLALGIGAKALDSKATAAAPVQLCVEASGAEVFDEAEREADPVGKVKGGVRVQVIREHSSWRYVEYGKSGAQKAWIRSADLTPCAAPVPRTSAAKTKGSAFHPFGRPRSEVHASGGVVLEREGYDCSYDPDRKSCSWVGYCYKAGGKKAARYGGGFVADPDIKAGEGATPDDYKGLYAKDGSGFDRGHEAPDATLKALGKSAQKETYYLSNITPQYTRLNQGFWRELEAAIRDWGDDEDGICVETGPVFENRKVARVGPNDVAVPHAYFAIAVRKSPPDVIAFLAPNEPVRHDWSEAGSYLKTVREVEHATGFDFLPDLPDGIEEHLENMKLTEPWER